MIIFDTHAHLADNKFALDREAVIERAFSKGVSYILAVADSLEGSKDVYELAEKYTEVYPTAGIHPHNAISITSDDLDGLRTFVENHPKIKAIGETGIDLYYGKETLEEQKKIFEFHLALARDFYLPIIIHSRDAEEAILPLIEQYLPVTGVFHCFTGDKNYCKRVLELGYYVSFSGIATFKNAQIIREAIEVTPLDRILVETDCPYLSPEGFRGKRNEPSFIHATIDQVAEIKKLDVTKIAEITTINAKRLFNIED